MKWWSHALLLYVWWVLPFTKTKYTLRQVKLIAFSFSETSADEKVEKLLQYHPTHYLFKCHTNHRTILRKQNWNLVVNFEDWLSTRRLYEYACQQNFSTSCCVYWISNWDFFFLHLKHVHEHISIIYLDSNYYYSIQTVAWKYKAYCILTTNPNTTL